MGLWFRKNHARRQDSETVPATSATPETSETADDTNAEEKNTAETAVSSRQYWNSDLSAQDWMSEMYREQERRGAFEHLAGKGKQLNVPSGDVTNSILKEANFLPAWLILQHEIRDQLQGLLETGSSVSLESALEDLNKKIAKYNQMVPNPMLQKWKLNGENMRQQFERWK
ncbi:DUF1992 domain-containing protein [Paenibacillus rhizovicinus]|uniref:DUF1992 domain-containing protein n=1 Tax=Paenibacillus rhizovicinus TaxID=2704463 RepID=A0A6C0NU40_9BACL|nr:DnaJ family domain-containing protein [Paenibacillus rhizovicinus]QHW29695.1 DUF1992 domain-containing protein [Paenibacillus rhizovicinus]